MSADATGAMGVGTGIAGGFSRAAITIVRGGIIVITSTVTGVGKHSFNRRTMALETDRDAVQIVGIGAFDLHGRDLANA